MKLNKKVVMVSNWYYVVGILFLKTVQVTETWTNQCGSIKLSFINIF